jgi:hypothetical protein
MTEFDRRITQARGASRDVARQVKAHIEAARQRRVSKLLDDEVERPVVPETDDEPGGREPFTEAGGLP